MNVRTLDHTNILHKFKHFDIYGDGSAFSTEPNAAFSLSFLDEAPNFCMHRVFFEMPMSAFKNMRHMLQAAELKDNMFYICISHMHEDHVGGLATFLFYLKYMKGVDLTRKVYLICENRERMEQYLDLTMGKNRDTFPIYEDEMLITSDTKIIAHPMKHGNMSSVGFEWRRVDTVEMEQPVPTYSDFFYTGDCSEIPADILDAFHKMRIDVLISEISRFPEYKENVHLSYEKIINEFTISELQRIIFLHFDSYELKKQIQKIQEDAMYFSGKEIIDEGVDYK